MEERKPIFESKIKPLLKYIGTLGAILMSLAYIIVVCILVFGFKAVATLNLTIFAVVNAAVGLIIMQMLKVQGIDFAKDLPENKALVNEYYGTTTKDKKDHSINYFWVTSIIKDVIIKGITLAASTIGVVYLVIEGSSDLKLLLLAAVNLIMFICFGLLSLVKAYDFYNEYHVKFMKDRLKESKNESLQGERITLQPKEGGGTGEDKEGTEQMEKVLEKTLVSDSLSLEVDISEHSGH